MFKNMKFRVMLGSGFVMVILLLITVIAIYQYAVNSTMAEFTGLLEGEVAIAEHAAKADDNNNKVFLGRNLPFTIDTLSC